MSLDTVLQIGSALRNAPKNLKHFKYLMPCPKDKDGTYTPLCITIPVNDNFSLSWNEVSLVPENQRENLFYLTFKTSNSDGFVKYIFGDIYYTKTSQVSKSGEIKTGEGGYYRLSNPEHSNKAFQKSSFGRGDTDFEDIIKQTSSPLLKKFRHSLEEDLYILETILNNITAVEAYFDEQVSRSFADFITDTSSRTQYAKRKIFDKAGKATLKKIGIESSVDDLTDDETQKLLLLDAGEIFIHFSFSDGSNWYDFKNELNAITQKMLADFVDPSSFGFTFKKTLYKTLCSGDSKNDIQFPGFQIQNKYKSRVFSDVQVQDLFYAIDYTSKGRLILGTEIKIIVLPKGENLTAEDYEFFQNNRDEVTLKSKNQEQNSEEEPAFDFISGDVKENILSFDVIFSKRGSNGMPDVDLMEISGLEKSKIRTTKDRIENIAKEISVKRKNFLKITKELFPTKLEYAFKNILGNPQADLKSGKITIKPNPKYQSHILKVLPLIYTDSYYRDDVTLPAFIQNIEFTIRAGDNKYNFLKFDLEFLLKIQNNQKDKFMEITNSESYQLGLLLGSMAKNLSQEIKSFEKNYVGNLTRRIGSLEDFIKLKNDIEQKLIMHEKSKFTYQLSYDLAQKVKDFSGQYDKEECAFGFFETYFKPISKKKEDTVEN